MAGKSRPRALVLATCLCGALALAGLSQAQSPPPAAAKAELAKAVEERAQRDAHLRKQAEGVTGLEVLFGKDAAAAGMSMSEVLSTYEDAFTAAVPPEPWWRPLQPLVTLAGLAALAWLVIQNFLKEHIARLLKRLAEVAYNQLAGFRPFWWFALTRYRRALIDRYHKLKIPFRPDRPLDVYEVYVPLKVAGTGGQDLVDAHQAIASHGRLLVLGAPGAGKSMLLKQLALTYARGERGHVPGRPIPVLLELNRLNDSAGPLFDELAEVLKGNRFPHPGGFLKANLARGRLILLFDGLDEVNSEKRQSVAKGIRDLLDQYPECRAVVTCRRAVYREELGDWPDRKLDIAEFSDQQIHRFLGSWQRDMPAGKSAGQLLEVLRDRPRIMALARNPLLLTIIAYLYCDTDVVLPHSRTEFYSKSVTLLLDLWKGNRNRYTAAQKRLVLQQLALAGQDRLAESRQDRRSFELPLALAEVKKVLPSLMLKDDDAQPILNEIVDRSGLLLRLDGGVKYQFTHLTLQEFFAALALEPDTGGLASRFRAHPDVWRETVKLWCGLEHDATGLINAVYETDAVTAFECLGDAQKVDPDAADRIAEAFKSRLGEGGTTGELVRRAIAAVAASPRGQRLLDFLISSAADQDAGPEIRLAAAQALSGTNLPKAAQVLAELASQAEEFRPMLAQMGDTAVDVLADSAAKGNAWALDALEAIATPGAALALAHFLWEPALEHRAAWGLAALLMKPGVESALRECPITPEQRKADRLDWVWEPFERSATSPLRILVGRVAHLLYTAPQQTIPSGPPRELDPRLVIPLCLVVGQGKTPHGLEHREGWPLAEKCLIPTLGRLPPATELAPEREGVFAERIARLSGDRTWLHLFHSLPRKVQFKSVLRLLGYGPRTATPDDWRDILRPAVFQFQGSWQARGAWLSALVLVLPVLWALGATLARSSSLVTWENALASLTGVVILALVWAVTRLKEFTGTHHSSEMFTFFLATAGPCMGAAVGSLKGVALGAILGLVFGPGTLLLAMACEGAAQGRFEKTPRYAIGASGLAIGCVLAAVLGGLLGGVSPGAIPGAIGLMIIGLFLSVFMEAASRPHYSETRASPRYVLVLTLAFGLIGAFFGALSIPVGTLAGGVLGLAVGWPLVAWAQEGHTRSLRSFVASATSDPAFVVQAGFVGLLVTPLVRCAVESLLPFASWSGMALAWLAAFAVASIFLGSAQRRERQATNPLHGLLELAGLAQTPADKA